MGKRWILWAAMLALLLSGCGAAMPQAPEGALRVVATTSLVGDAVRVVGGEEIALTVLMAPGQDPHSYEATAQDLRAVERADLVFVNGLGFEEALLAQVESVARAPVVALSDGVEPLEGDEAHAHESEEEHAEHADPHVWWEVENVRRWTANAAEALAGRDAANADRYRARAADYDAELAALDEEIRAAIAALPPERRKLVTTHGTLGYFAHAYGFEMLGTVLPGFSTGAEPSASELSALSAAMREAGVRALFVESTVNDRLSRVVADETGATLHTLYTDALGPAGSGAESYIGFMRTNVRTIVAALSEP